MRRAPLGVNTNNVRHSPQHRTQPAFSRLVSFVQNANISRAWSLGGLTTSDLIRAVRRSSDEHDLPGRAAQLSFFFLLAIFPLLIFVSALLGYVFAAEQNL